jgi:hypothetical protein
MAIHFSCTKCNKPMFAQDQYAGRVVLCPTCQTRNTIPAATPPAGPQPLHGLEEESTFVPGRVQTPASVSPLVEGDSQLLDMEKPPVVAVTTVVPPTQPVAATESAPSAPMATPAPTPGPAVAPEDATRRCPICAETIKVLAKKCRFCGAIFDESLRESDEHDRKTNVSSTVVGEAGRIANTWRAIAVAACGLTIGWLCFITANIWSFSEPNLLMLFNPLLVIGLIWSSRQMKNGPPQVFFSAALAILLCMPLNMMLGLPLGGPQFEQDLVKQMQEKMKDATPEQIIASMRVFWFLMFLAIDFVVSLPVWIAMIQVAGVQRLQAKLGKPK